MGCVGSLKRLETSTVGGMEGGGQAASNRPLFNEIQDFVIFVCWMVLVGSIVVVLTPTNARCKKRTNEIF